MTPTKEQQAQEYAEKKFPEMPPIGCLFPHSLTQTPRRNETNRKASV
nr:MAG TPA: hypothetical protein [Caudoviricetes sp.]